MFDGNDFELWKHYVRAFPAVILAVFGGFVRVIQATEEFTVPRLLTGICSAAFVGILLYFLMHDWDYSPTVKAAIIGVGGYAFGDILPFLNKLVKDIIAKKLGYDLDNLEEKKKEKKEEVVGDNSNGK